MNVLTITRRRGYAAVMLVAASLVSPHAEPASCETTCGPTVLGSFAVEQEGLRIVVPEVADLRKDDIILQLNSHRLRGCADLQRALDEARRGDLALILLLRRGGERQTQWIESARERAAAEAIVDVPRASQPTAARATAQSPAAISPVATAAPLDAETVRAELSSLLAFGRELQSALPVTSAERWVRDINRLIRARATPASLDGLDRVFSYYTTVAEILVYREKETRDRGSGRRRAGLILEYGSGEVTNWLEKYPFLRESVERPYDRERLLMTGRRMGLWSPDEAVRLLVERALSETEALNATSDEG